MAERAAVDAALATWPTAQPAPRRAPPAPAAARASCGPGSYRLDQPGRAQLRRQAPRRRAGRRLRRRDILRIFSTSPRALRVVHVCDDIACAAAGAQGSARRCNLRRAAGRGRRRRGVASQPVPRSLRSRAGCARNRAGERRRRSNWRPSARTAWRTRWPKSRSRATRRRRTSGGPAARAIAARREGESRESGRVSRARRLSKLCGRPSSSARPESSPRSSRRICWAAAAPPFPRAAKWRRSRRSRRPTALPHLQRRRIRARHLQRSRPDGRRSVRRRRSNDDRRLRGRLRARLHLHSR